MIADTISYNQKTDVLTATGNITMLEPDGNVIFAEYLEMTGDFKNGVIANIRMILSDNSRIAANGARRINGDLDLRKAVYSPCKACEDHPERALLWQIKAVKIYHDSTRKSIEYTDAWLEVAGVPIFYTPYLTHPDPTVKRETGFLAPSFGNNSELGFFLQTPYFLNISEQTDMTITPAVYGNQGIGLTTEFRHNFMNGELQAEASLVDEDTGEFNGHIDSFGRFNIDQTWRWGFDANYTTEDTYLRRYDISSPQTLTSNIYSEGFRGRNYIRADSFYFQGLASNDNQDTTPLILPLVSFQHKGKPDKLGGQSSLDASFVSLTRDDGADMQRISLRPGWSINHVSSFGEAYKLSIDLDTDLYRISNHTPAGDSEFDGYTARIYPQAKFDWRLPMVKQSGNTHQLIEPITSLIIAPNNVNNKKIPNEDSLEFEFDESSLFSRSRFTGEDRAEGGSRIDYGLQWGVYGASGGKTTAFIGQSYRLHKDNTFVNNSGLEDNLSDIVAKVEVSPSSYFNLSYRTRIAKDNGDFKRNELSVSAGVPLLQFKTQYQFFDKQRDSEFEGREDITVGLNSIMNRNWRGTMDIRHDLADNQTRSFGTKLIYEDECLVFTSSFARTFYNDRDLKPNDTLLFAVSFKTLGEVRLN
jgi:LPS-assembly protein